MCGTIFCNNFDRVLSDGLLNTSRAEFSLDHQQLGREERTFVWAFYLVQFSYNSCVVPQVLTGASISRKFLKYRENVFLPDAFLSQ